MSSNNHNKTSEIKEESLIKTKRKRPEEKKELKKPIEKESDSNDLMKKIINYLLYICKNIETFELDNNKICLLKVFEYLKDYKMDNAINFLKKTSLGIMVKYIGSKIEDEEVVNSSGQVYKNFEEQVLEQLFAKTSK